MQIARKLTFIAALAAALFLPNFAAAESATSTMKAIVIYGYGGPEVLKYEDVPRPEPKAEQILIRVIAAGVNPVDGMIRSGMFAKDGNCAFPMVLGGDISVVVDWVGNKFMKIMAVDNVL